MRVKKSKQKAPIDIFSEENNSTKKNIAKRNHNK